MEEPHIEGVANHGDPESCAGFREGVGEALTGVPVKYSELPAIVYIFRPQVQMRPRGTLGPVLPRGSLDGLPLANTHPELTTGWQRARADGDPHGGNPR